MILGPEFCTRYRSAIALDLRRLKRRTTSSTTAARSTLAYKLGINSACVRLGTPGVVEAFDARRAGLSVFQSRSKVFTLLQSSTILRVSSNVRPQLFTMRMSESWERERSVSCSKSHEAKIPCSGDRNSKIEGQLPAWLEIRRVYREIWYP